MASYSINGFARSCRALMAAAKGSASATVDKATVVGGKAPRGIQKPLPLSRTLSKFFASPEASRGQVTKKIWEYIKLNNLEGRGKSIFMVSKGKGKPVAKNFKGKGKGISKPKRFAKKGKEKVSKTGNCHHCYQPGHWKRNCHIYLDDKKKGVGNFFTSTKSGFKKMEKAS